MYNIGLDIGTGSVGWCLTDENGYLLKVNRKGNNGNTYRNSAWGVRLFESADTAADCRIKRSTRRRYNRRRTRIIELRKIMSDMIMPIDPNFYAMKIKVIKLKHHFYYLMIRNITIKNIMKISKLYII